MDEHVQALLGFLGLTCLIALILDMWKRCTGAMDRLLWILVFIGLSYLGSMLYLAAHDSRIARAVILLQIIISIYMLNLALSA